MNASQHLISAPQQDCFKREMSRLISAAVVNQHFRSMLLNDPAAAVNAGYSGEKFSLTDEDKAQIGRVHAANLAEFAAQIAAL